MISTHFRRPHRPSERELRFVDLYARQATEMIERNRAEEALRASEERFRRYFELGLIGMAMTSPTKGILEVNDELCRILGYERSELLQKSWAEMTHPDDLAADVAQFNSVVAGEIDGYTLDKRWIRKDGQVIDTIMAAKCLRRADGSVDYFVGLVQDITERKWAEEELRRSEERFRLLVESIRDYAIFALDPSGHVISWNTGAEHIMAYRSKEIIGRHFSCFYPPEELGVGKPEMDLRIAAAEGRFEDEGWRIRKDGSRFWANVVITALRGPQGELAGFSKITRDLTEPKQAEEALGEAQAELAHVTRVMSLGELTASIAHEVNQPLGAIVTNGQACLRLLARKAPDLQKSREVIERMISDGMRASEVITRIRALLKRTEAEKALLHVNEIIQEVITLTSTELSKSEIHLQTALAAELPLVLGDRVQLQQVILNLILNAKEAMNTVGWQPRELIITSLTSTSGEVVVAVRDSGTGLDPRHGDRIFEAFFTTKGEGLGLGLSISRRIIEAHGGRLWATPNEDQGTTIRFTLPASGRRG
jgi:PAS domain S-box-containing protein